MNGGGKDQWFGRRACVVSGESFRRSSILVPNFSSNERRVDHNHVEGVTERLVEAQGMVVVEVNIASIVGPGRLGIKVKEVEVAPLGLIKGEVEGRRRQEGYSRCILVQRCHSFLYGVAQRIDRVLGIPVLVEFLVFDCLFKECGGVVGGGGRGGDFAGARSGFGIAG